MRRWILLAAVAVICTACGGSSSPTTPTTLPSSAPPGSSGTTRWMVTHRFASVEGPDNCWVRQQRSRLTGVTFTDLPMTITRASGAITIESEWFQTYKGTYSGTEFTASGTRPLEGGGTVCDGTTYEQKPGVTSLSGRFSEDDQRLTATEVNSYVLTTGESVTYKWGWEAKRN
jgi:hypothetical protein